MTDNQNDDFLDTGDLDADSGLEDFETGRMSLAEAWKTNPMVKIGGVLGAVAIIIGGIMLFGGNNDVVSPSVVGSGRGSEVKEAPGGKVSEAYRLALEEANEKSVEEAMRNNESSLPVPIGPSRGKVLEGEGAAAEEDPLERWRKIQEERLRKEQEVKVTPVEAPQKPVDPYAQEKNALAQSMQTQMQSILETVGPKGPESITIASVDFLQEKRESAVEKLKEEKAEAAANAVTAGTVEILLEAGRIEYAQLITEANTDSPGPVLAQLASGPLAGSRLIGTFEKHEEHLTLTFDTIVVDGIAMATEAVALDPDTARPGVITEIDHKYFQRIILPAAAAFVEGIGSAIAESGTTTVTVDGGAAVEESSNLDADQEFFKGVEKASEKLGEILDEDGQSVEPMLRVASGTHIGLLFTQAVEKRDEIAQKLADEEKKKEQQAQLIPGAPQFLFQVPPGVNPAQLQLSPTLTGAGQGGQTTTGGQ